MYMESIECGYSIQVPLAGLARRARVGVRQLQIQRSRLKTGSPYSITAAPTVYPIDPIKVSFRMLPLCPQAPEIRTLRPGRYTHSKIPYAIHASLTAHFYSNGSMKGIQEVILLWGCWYCARRCVLDRDFCTFPNISLINTH